MVRAVDDIRTGKTFGYDWFAQERVNFIRAIRQGLDTPVGRKGTL
jgi:hypothetical protein